MWDGTHDNAARQKEATMINTKANVALISSDADRCESTNAHFAVVSLSRSDVEDFKAHEQLAPSEKSVILERTIRAGGINIPCFVYVITK